MSFKSFELVLQTAKYNIENRLNQTKYFDNKQQKYCYKITDDFMKHIKLLERINTLLGVLGWDETVQLAEYITEEYYEIETRLVCDKDKEEYLTLPKPKRHSNKNKKHFKKHNQITEK